MLEPLVRAAPSVEQSGILLDEELQIWLNTLLEHGRIAPDTDVPLAADTLFAVYTSAVHEWSATHPGDLGAAESRLRDLLALPVRGLLAATDQSVNAAARRTGTA